LNQAYSKPSFKLPPGILSYTYNDDKTVPSGLVQVGENMKWDIDESMRPSATSNEDVIDYLDEPMTRFA